MTAQSAYRLLVLASWALMACEVDVWLGEPLLPDVVTVVPDVVVVSPVGTPCLRIVPGLVDFGVVSEADQGERLLSLRNTCDERVIVSGFLLSGSTAFTLQVDGAAWSSTPETAVDGVVLSEPVAIEPGGEMVVPVVFEPAHGDAAFANAVWVSDDPNGGFGLAVQLRGNTATPCIVTFPKALDFGGSLLSEASHRDLLVRSCGDLPLTIASLTIDGAAAAGFALAPGSALEGLEVAPGEMHTLSLIFVPSVVAEVDSESAPVRERAALHLLTDAFHREATVDMTGFGAAEACPHAVIAPGAPARAAPEDEIVLDGGASYAIGADVVEWSWSLEGPSGAITALEPTSVPSRVRLSSNALGLHTVSLTVTDSNGVEACAPTLHAVDISLDARFVVELWWETDGDPDRTDTGLGAGTDLDLHLLHALAVGLDITGDGAFDGWFDMPFDAYWGNPTPNWGVVGDPKAGDDPVLVHDDFDGWGPERIVLDVPEPDGVYRIGVHHWSSHGYGPATAWVRVWWDQVLVHDAGGTLLPPDTLWDVGVVGPGGAWTSAVPAPLLHPGVRKPSTLKTP